MRKLTRKARKWHQIRARNELKQRHKRSAKRRAQRIRRAQRPASAGIANNPPAHIRCPANLSLEDNFEEVTKLLRDVRSHGTRDRNEHMYIDFKPIEKLTPSGALVLAAELDRWNHVRNSQRRLTPVDLGKWQRDVRSLLRGMGFFDLLNVPPGVGEADELPVVRYVKFRRGSAVDGEAVERLRELDLIPHVSVPNRRLLFEAVTEAMTNVKQHAYPDRKGTQGPKCWWMSAAYNTQSGEVAILIYDQGEGIPATLPRKFGEQLRRTLPPGWTKDHARLIEAAHELFRTGTRWENRGLGLGRNIRRYIEKLDGNGIYRVMSGKGEYTVRTGLSASPSRRSFRRSLGGTLIEWRIAS